MVVARFARGECIGPWRFRQNSGRVGWMACPTWSSSLDGTARQGRARPLSALGWSGQRVVLSGVSWGVLEPNS